MADDSVEAHGLGRRGARLLHVLADDRQRIPLGRVLTRESDVTREHAPRTRQRQAKEHVVGDEVREIVRLIGCSGNARPMGYCDAWRRPTPAPAA